MKIKYKFVRYIIVGVINTIIGYGIIFGLMLIGVIPEIANIIGYVFGIIISYVLNKTYTFKTSKNIKKEFPKFIFAMILAYTINLIILIILYRYFGINKYIATAIASVFYTLSGYIFSKWFVF